MANATFVRTGLADTTGQIKSQAVIDVDGEEVTVEFWYDLIEQWGKDGAKQYLCAEALWQTGNYADAQAIIYPNATGLIGQDMSGAPTDTRNWQQNWLDNHPIPAVLSELELDPLV
jgi:hypothetical protein